MNLHLFRVVDPIIRNSYNFLVPAFSIDFLLIFLLTLPNLL